jgi:hypothetical protein
MAYTIVPVDEDDELTPVEAPAAAPAAPADTAAVPEIGPKNIYKNGRAQPQISTTKTITIPSASEYTLPKVVDAGAEPAADTVKPTPKVVPVDDDDELVPPSEVYKPGSDYAITRGFKTGFTGAGSAIGTAAEIPGLLQMSDEEARDALLKKAATVADPRNAQLQAPSFSEIDSLGKGATWLGEAIGSTAGSWLGAGVYGGLPGAGVGGAGGAAVGSVVPGLGTAVGAGSGALGGFTYGTAAGFAAMGVGGMLDEMLQEKDIQKQLRDGTLSPKKLIGIASGAGAAIGLLDALPAGKFIARIGGKEVSEDAVKLLLRKAAIRGATTGALEEAGTEGGQGTISEFTKAITSGDWDVANRALSVLNQAATGAAGGAGPGAVGAVVENARIPDVANPVVPAGEEVPPGAADAAAAAETSTPGGTSAVKPAAPADATTPATPAATPAVKADVDPAVAAAAAATQPATTTTTTTTTPAAPATTTPEIPDVTGETLEEEPLPGGAAAGAIPEEGENAALQDAIGQVLAQQEAAARAQEQAAAATTVADGNADVTAAIAAGKPKRTRKPRAPAGVATTPVEAAAQAAGPQLIPTPAVNIGETLGTGRATAGAPAEVPVITEPSSVSTDAAPRLPGEPPSALPLENAGPLAALQETTTPTPTPAVSLQPVAQPSGITSRSLAAEFGNKPGKMSDVLSERVNEAIDRNDDIALEIGGKRVRIEDVSGEGMIDEVGTLYPFREFVLPTSKARLLITPAEKAAPPALAAQEPAAGTGTPARPAPVAVETPARAPVVEPAPARPRNRAASTTPAELIKAEPAAAPAAPPRAAAAVAVSQAKEPARPPTKGELIRQRAREAAEKARAKPAEAAQPAEVAAQPAAAPTLTIARKEPVPTVRKRVRAVVPPKPTAVVAERVEEAAAPEKPAAAPSPPAAAPAGREALDRQLVGEVTADVRTHDDVTQSRLDDLPKDRVAGVVESVAAEFVGREPKAGSPSEILTRLRRKTGEIIAEVKRRLEPDIAQFERESRTAMQKAEEAKADRAADAAAKREEQAKATTGQKKERAKASGMSAAGIKVQSDESVLNEEKKQLKKKPEKRDPLVLQHAQLVREKQKKETTPERKAEIAELEEAVREARISKAEAAAEAGPGLSDKHREVESKLEQALKGIDRPEVAPTDTAASQLATAREYLAAFLKAIEGIKVAGRHDSKHNSPLENLAVYAHKLRKKEADVSGHGAGEFYLASGFMDEGSIDQFNNLVTNEMSKGAELREETTGRGDEDVDVAEQLEEGEVIDRTFRFGGEAALERRGGREGAVSRSMAEGARADASAGPSQVTAKAADGSQITVYADTASASSRLRELTGSDIEQSGFFSFFRNMHVRRLMQLVGDVPVHIISDWDMQRLTGRGGVLGLYRNPLAGAMAKGAKGVVYISESAYAGVGGSYSHTLTHELTHAATMVAYNSNINGAARAIRRLREGMLAQLRAQGMTDAQLHEAGVGYGLVQDKPDMADLEFIAEAFSNQEFQHLLASFNVPRELQADLITLTRGRPLSWWEAFTSAVSQAIGMVRGQRGNTYMEQVVALYPSLMKSSTWQSTHTRELLNRFSQLISQGMTVDEAVRTMDAETGNSFLASTRRPGSAPDTALLTANFRAQVDAVKDSATSGWATIAKGKLANRLATVGEMQRRAEKFFGGLNNAFTRLSDVLLKKDPLRAMYRAMGQKNEVALLELQRSNPQAYEEVSEWAHESSRFQIDPMHPVTHPNNKHAGKTGPRGAQQRAEHARRAAQWAGFSPEVRKTISDAAAHYRKMHELQTTAMITHAVTAAMKKYRVADKVKAAGYTTGQVVDWVRSGNAARAVDERDATDVAMHAALGESAETIGAIPELRRLKGLYFPLARRGRWFVTATEKLATPPGAVADPSSPDGNRFFFPTKKALEDYLGGTEYLAKGTSMWVDPKTRQRIKKGGKEAVYTDAQGNVIVPVQVFVATVQNKHLHMHDNKNTLAAIARELAAAGHTVSQAALTQDMLDQGASDITPRQLQTVLRNLEQTTLGANTIGQQAVKDAFIDSTIRAMTRPSALKRGIKRKGTIGYDTDMAAAMREYNQSTASHLANLELAHEMAEADSELSKFINDRRKSTSATTNGLPPATGNEIAQLQMMQAEVHHRFKSLAASSEKGFGSRLANAMMNTSFLKHLMSPHYTVMNLLQTYMTSMPVISAEYGFGATWREAIAFYRMGGVRKALGTGLGETWAATRNINPYSAARVTEAELAGRNVQDQLFYDLVAGEPDGKELQDMYGGLVSRGWGASSGIEAGAIAETELTRAEVFLNRTMNVAKAMPEAAEGINRYQTATMAYRLARRAGMSIEDAQRKAWLTVEQTQGGYARANNPTFFNNSLLRFPMQFKKYGLMYGQMYYGNLAKLVAPSSKPEERKLAAKTLARMSAMTMTFAGVGGLPMIEIARLLANTALMLGLSDDDWEDWENGMQAWFSDFVGTGMSEASMHGLTRLVDIDTSAAMGADNLVTFGQPRTMDEEGVLSWLAKTALGAPGTMAVETFGAVNQGDLTGIIPWPKLIDNMVKAYGLFNEGTVDPNTGEQYADPVSLYEAGVKTLGFQPASSARQWESGGTGRQSVEDRQEMAGRRRIMGRWSAAKQRGDNAEAQRIFREDVKAWNEGRDRKMRIDMGDLYRSRDERKRQRREREKAAAQ